MIHSGAFFLGPNCYLKLRVCARVWTESSKEAQRMFFDIFEVILKYYAGSNDLF